MNTDRTIPEGEVKAMLGQWDKEDGELRKGPSRTVTIRQNDDGSVDTPKYDLMDELLNGSVVHFEETVASMGEFLTQALEKLDVKAKIEWIMLDSEWSVDSTIGYFKVNKI